MPEADEILKQVRKQFRDQTEQLLDSIFTIGFNAGVETTFALVSGTAWEREHCGELAVSELARRKYECINGDAIQTVITSMSATVAPDALINFVKAIQKVAAQAEPQTEENSTT